jgi:aromatic-L-amino-acid decarboxylase
MSWQTSPAATELEEVVMDWLRQMVGLPQAFSGVVHDTASTATLVALLCARERTTNFSQNRGGLQAEDAPLVVYGSEQAHASVDKAALLAGFGRENVRLVESGADYAIRLDALEAAIEADLKAGRRPCALVGTVGSTATTAVDPLEALGALAARHRLWLHVDAAMAGSAMVLPECRAHWRGIEAADSLVFNPHKWLGAGFDFSAYYVRDPQHLIRCMSTNPSYLRTAQDAEVKNFRDWGIPLGRRFRALKLWLVLRDQGVEGLQARLRRDLENARWFAAQVDAEPGWERLAPVPFQTVCVRHLAPGLSGAALDAHNLQLAQRVNATGRAYVTPAVVKGAQLIRVSVGAEPTERPDVERLWTLLREEAARA